MLEESLMKKPLSNLGEISVVSCSYILEFLLENAILENSSDT